MAKPTRFNSDAYLRTAAQEIEAWETSRRGYLSRISDYTFDPAARLTARMVPSSVQKAICLVIENSLRLTAHAGQFSVDTEKIRKQRLKRLGQKRSLAPRLKACDDLAKRYWNAHCGYAAAEGAATGMMGIAGFVTDIPLILSVVIRSIRTIGLCYSYPPSHANEINYAFLVLRLGSSNKSDVKAQIFPLLDELERRHLKAGGASSANPMENPAFFTMQEYAKALGLEMVQRRALALVPIAGVVTAASFNAAFAHDIGKTAFMCYRRRFIREYGIERSQTSISTPPS